MSKIMTVSMSLDTVEYVVGALKLLGFDTEALIKSGALLVWDGTSAKPQMIPYGRQKSIPVDIVLKKTVWNGYGDVGIEVAGEDSKFHVDDIDVKHGLLTYADVNSEFEIKSSFTSFTDAVPQWYAVYAAQCAMEETTGQVASVSQFADGGVELVAQMAGASGF